MKGINGNIVDRILRDIKYIDNNVLDHFVGADKMVYIGSNTKRNINDYKLSGYYKNK